MSKQGRLGVSGVFLLASLCAGGHTHATECNFPPSEVLDLQLEAVTYDGVPVSPSEYVGLRGRLSAQGPGFILDLLSATGGVRSVEAFGVE